MKKTITFILVLAMVLSMTGSVFAVSSKDFTDVPNGAWYADAVTYAAEHNLFSGTSATEFSPNNTMTRGMFVTVLARMNGVNPTDITNNNKFTDIAFDDWYGYAVIWANENGIISGTSDTTFSPHSPINREQIAVILHRFMTNMGADMPVAENAVTEFKDANTVSGYAVAGVEAMRKSGFVSGDDMGNYNPLKNITRAEAATILTRISQYYSDADAVGITLNKNAATLEVGETFTIAAYVFPANADVVVTYTSSDAKIATVDADGVVTAVKDGTAVITATTANGKTSEFTVTVFTKVDVAGVTLSESSKTLTVGDAFTLTATVTPNNATDKTIVWSSSDMSVVTVDGNGKVTAVGVGSATITVTSVNGKVATCTVVVKAAEVAASFTTNFTEMNLTSDGENTWLLYNRITITDSWGTNRTLLPDSYTVTCSDSSVVTVSDKGELSNPIVLNTGDAPRTAVITVTNIADGTFVTITVTISYKSNVETPEELGFNYVFDDTYIEAYAAEVLRLVNELRISEGVDTNGNPLYGMEYGFATQSCANYRSQELLINFSHARPNGGTNATLQEEYNVHEGFGGENIGKITVATMQYNSETYIRRSPEDVAGEMFAGWENSSGHKVAMLRYIYTKMVVGLHIEDNRAYSAQWFSSQGYEW